MGWLPDPLHPAVIHFPIALVFVALAFELVARHPRGQGLATAAGVLVVVAALGAVAAVVTGNWAADEAVVSRKVAERVEDHEERGEVAMWTLLVVAAVRVLAGARRWLAGARGWVYIALLALAAVAVVRAAQAGGRLVFEHGVGVAAATGEAPGPSAQGETAATQP